MRLLLLFCAVLAACGDDSAISQTNPDGGANAPPGTPGANPEDGGTPPPVVTCGPTCALGDTCNVDTDCASRACSAAKKCVLAPSCKGTSGGSGIDTCGAGEVGDADAKHESCCTSTLLPSSTTRSLDRYLITAGRIREFVGDIAAQTGGDPNIRAWAKTYAAAHPDSQLGKVDTQFPGYLDAVLPHTSSADADVPLAFHLGVTPVDPINTLDGCFMQTGGYAHATYWQDEATLKTWHVGYGNPPDGTRKYSREVLDTKPMNCVMSVMLATFCAWDGGELATAKDYRAVWGNKKVTVGATDVTIAWSGLLSVGQFNWRNGHGAACPIAGWPGCVTNQPSFYRWPAAGPDPADDDSGAISAPGRFPLDVASSGTWFDIEGDYLQAIWLSDLTDHAKPANQINDVCDTSTTTGGKGACTRRGNPGVLRYVGTLPQSAFVGFSFEGHANTNDAYFASATDDETKLSTRTMHFQYGKLGGRCARNVTR